MRNSLPRSLGINNEAKLQLKNFAAELDGAIGLVTRSPQQWPMAEHATRRFVLQRFPFAIIYLELRGSIQVLAVAHGHRRPGYWKERL